MNMFSVPHTYLLAYDGSEHSIAALRLLLDFCAVGTNSTSIKVHLITVFTPRQIKDHQILKDSLDWAAKQLQINKCFDVSTDIVLGYPAEKILEISQQLKPDMVIIGAKGLRSTFGILLGGVAQQIIEYASCPVMIVRTPYLGLNKLLLVVDDSKCSRLAAKYLSTLPIAKHAEISTLHVLSPLPLRPPHKSIAETWPYGVDIGPPPVFPEETYSEEELTWQYEEELEGNTLLSNIQEILSKTNVDSSSVLLRGDAASEIMNYANSNSINLIISGSRGLSTIKGILLGSVSRKLVHYASCSILVFKYPEITQT